MSAKKRFSFDDEDEIVETRVPENKPKKKDFSFDDTIDDAREVFTFKKDSNTNKAKNSVKKKNGKMKKLKLNKWKVGLLAFLVIVVVFIIYAFVASGNDGPVYGDRCASLLSIDEKKIKDVESQIQADDLVESIKIKVECRIIKFEITLVEGATVQNGQDVSINAVTLLDQTMGYEKYEGSVYSELFNIANGRGQYNAEIIVTGGGEGFPIHGTKHPSSDEISFTTSLPKDEETTNEVKSQQSKQQ